MKKTVLFIAALAVLNLTVSNSNSQTDPPRKGAGMFVLGLVAYYPFNGNANDASGYGNDGVVDGATLTENRSGYPDSAYSFDGQDDYILVPDDPTLDLTVNITLAAWVYADSAIEYHRVISKGNNYELSRDNSSPPKWVFWVSDGPVLKSLVDMVTGSWVHLAATYDGAYMRIYVNGKENNQMARTGALTPDSTNLYIGDGAGHYFDGKLDEIRIYDRALSPPEIKRLAVSPWNYDYNGDGTSDIAIFRPNSGLWAIRGVTRVYFGSSTDTAVPGDYNGDGTTEIGIYRSSSGLWAIRDVTRAYFGSGNDLPDSGDYTGDGTSGIGIFRATSGLWALRGVTRIYFGSSADEPVPGYYAADGFSKDLGIFRRSSGLWAVRGVTRVYFGGSTDDPVPGDFNGDGAWEAGIYRPTSGLWAIRGVTRAYFGSDSDLPVQADYKGAGADTIGIFRGSSGLWAARSVTRLYFGTSGDLPVTR